MRASMRRGDCLNILPKLLENSIDSVITDPPYGLEFMGKDWDKGVPGKHFWEEVFRVSKPGTMMLAFGGTRTWHRLAVAIEDAGWEIRDTICWLYGQGFPKSHDISKAIDKSFGAKRTEIVGTRHRNVKPYDDENGWNENNTTGDYEYTAPSTNEAMLWNGWGTALKPAFEPIIMAMKPVDKSFANNALQHGVAGLWIDGSRIAINPEVDDPRLGGNGSWKTDKAARNVYEGGYAGVDIASSPNGRWPANVILDEESAVLVDAQSGETKGVHFKHGIYHPMPKLERDVGYKDSGGASRFFYCAKASKKERDYGLEETELKERSYMSTHNGTGETWHPIDDRTGKERDRFKSLAHNVHPTVKPLALLRYLCDLTRTPTGGIVLDPFMGSGSTGIACMQTGRSFFGIEIENEYYQIARLRIRKAFEENRQR